MCKEAMTFEELEREAAKLGQETTIEENKLAGLNDKKMKKVTQYMRMAMDDFQGIVEPTFLIGDSSTMGEETEMQISFNGLIEINRKYYDSPMDKNRENKLTHYNYSYKYKVANENYSAVHEFGHYVNIKLIEKIRGRAIEKSAESNEYVDLVSGVLVAGIVAEAFENYLKQTTENDNFDIRYNNYAEKYNNTKVDINLMLEHLVSSEQGDVLSMLSGEIYSSGYAISNVKEFFAEAFADYYWDKGKKKKAEDAETAIQCNAMRSLFNEDISDEKIKTTKYVDNFVNPISKYIVETAQKLWSNKKELQEFIQRHNYKDMIDGVRGKVAMTLKKEEPSEQKLSQPTKGGKGK